jgi:hypothetical protein
MLFLRTTYTRRIVANLADFHGGHELGLLSPETKLQEIDALGNVSTYTPRLTATQEYLWSRYHDHDIPELVKLAGDDEIIVLVGGDLTQGQKYKEHWVSTRASDQYMIGFYNLLPLLRLPNVKTMRIVQGTGAHTFGQGSSEILIAHMLGVAPDKDVKFYHHGLLDVSGCTIDAAHHGPCLGIRNWTHGNVARLYLQSLMDDELDLGHMPPRIVSRAHYHVYAHAYHEKEHRGVLYKSDLVVTPSYCGLDGYGQQATRSAFVQVHGMVAYEIVDGELNGIYPIKETVDLRTKETV